MERRENGYFITNEEIKIRCQSPKPRSDLVCWPQIAVGGTVAAEGVLSHENPN